MKKKFFLLAGLLLSLDCLAQDVIVKKDGSTILAKVLVVGDDVVEYKKFSNQDGPTYKISTSNLLSINYQSGDKDTFADNNAEADGGNANETGGIQAISYENMSQDGKEANKAALQFVNSAKSFTGGNQKAKGDAFLALGYYNVTKESLLANEDIEISAVIGNMTKLKKSDPGKWEVPVLAAQEERPAIQFSIRNKTNNTIYLDLGNTFYIRGGNTICYYVPSATTSSHTSSGGVGVNLGAVAGALNVGGAIGTLANGVNVGGGSSNTTTNIVYSQRVIAVPAKSIKPLDAMMLFGEEPLQIAQGLRYKPWGVSTYNFRMEVNFPKKSPEGEMQALDHYVYQEDPSRVHFSFSVAYSKSENLTNMKSMSASYYLAGLVGISTWTKTWKMGYSDKSKLSLFIKVKNDEGVSYPRK